MTTPEVTAVITSFNQRQFIEEAVESVIRQQGTALETIVVDDGSYDGTADVAASFAPRVRVIRTAHRGVAAARNIGWESGTADLIAFLDGDDFWLPGKLALQVRVLHQQPEAGLVYADTLRMRADGTPIDRWSTHMHPVEGDALFPMLLQNRVHTSTVVMRRAALQELGGFDERRSVWEDIDLWSRTAARFRFAYVPEVLSRYRMHGNGISQDATKMARARLTSAERLLGELPLVRFSARDRQEVMAAVYGQVALAHYLNSDMPMARHWLIRSWQTDQRSLLRPRSLTTFAKSLAGPFVIGWLRATVRPLRTRNRTRAARPA